MMVGTERIAADVGGTFTDVAFIGKDGSVTTKKVLSTPGDYSVAVVNGVRQLMDELGMSMADLSDVLHGTTVATNAILERRGSRTALITTRGMRDVLELRRIRMPHLYDPLYEKPVPLVAREHRFEVTERIDGQGNVVTPLDVGEVGKVVEAIRQADIEAVAVTFLHSYLNAEHERLVGEIVRRELPDCFVTLSSEILPEIREYERTSTTVINAYLGPPVKSYLKSLESTLASEGMHGRVMVMQSSGGMLDARTVAEKPAQIVECGPAAGVIGGAYLGRELGYDNLITFDMGGTTAKASLIENGNLVRTDEYEVGGGISLSSRLVKGGGYALKIPVIDIGEVGAGGGSMVWFDRAGQIKVGPQSAGAQPGPACYGTGGEEPTVTDANVVLGYLNPSTLAGGTVPIDPVRARAVIEEKIGKPLGRELLEVAYGVHIIANANMVRAVKAVSTYQGRDPRDFAMLAFGGSGGVHAVEMARSLGMTRVIVPVSAGVFSAIGLIYSDVELALSIAHLRVVDDVDPAAMAEAYRKLEEQITTHLGCERELITFKRYAELRYVGQAYELTVSVPPGRLTGEIVASLSEAFEVEHDRTYGHRFPGYKAVQVISLRLTGSIVPEGNRIVDAQSALKRAGAGAAEHQRLAYFGPQLGELETAVLNSRSLLGSGQRHGPLIIEEYEGTIVVPPGARASLDGGGNIVIDVDPVANENAAAATGVDPYRLEVIKNGFDTIADEMTLIILRTAYSAIVRDTMDYSTAICDSRGLTLAQGLTTPMHLGSFYDAMQHLIGQYANQVVSGDVFIGNDPFTAAGQHLPDIYIIVPIFIDGELQGWATTIAHHCDVGGIVPGSNALGASEIYQEGLRLPFVKLYEAGTLNQGIWDIIRTNVRVPEMVLGDLHAQTVACHVGAREYEEMFRRYGVSTMHRYIDELHDYAERLARSEFADMPDGTYEFTDHIDGLGEDPQPIIFHVALTVKGDEVTVDWTGSSPQVAGGVNSSLPFTKAASYTPLRSIMSGEVPNCHGYTRPITVVAPPGTVTNMVHPAACGARGISGFRMIDCLFGALGKVVPEKIAADGCGGSTLPTLAGYRNGKAFVHSETLLGTWGGTAGHDGQEGVPHLGANQSNVPIELIEIDNPVRIEQYGFVPDTGGAGKFRGGLSIIRDYRILEDDVTLTLRSDKRSHPPHGLCGGRPGGGSMSVLNPDAEAKVLPVLLTTPEVLNKGDLFRHVKAAGGGYGDPLEREPEAVLADVVAEKVTREHAVQAYGVVISGDSGTGLSIDHDATDRQRSEIAARDSGAGGQQ